MGNEVAEFDSHSPSRDIGLDLAVLEAAEPAMVEAFPKIDHTHVPENPHDKSELRGRYKPWSYEEILTPQILLWALDDKVPKLTAAEAREVGIDLPKLILSLQLFDITESGNVYYPQQIRDIYDPLNHPAPEVEHFDRLYAMGAAERGRELAELKLVIPKSILFPRFWTAQEQPHEHGGMQVLRMLGVDMAAHARRKMAWITTDSTPRPENTPAGAAYTDPQEGNTAGPYGVVSGLFAQLSHQAGLKMKFEAQQIYGAISQFYKCMALDEAGHRAFIRASRIGALINGDTKVKSYVVTETAKTLVKTTPDGNPSFPMPGFWMRDFSKGTVAASLTGLLTLERSALNVRAAINAMNLDRMTDLSDLGVASAEQLLGYVSLLNQVIERERNN